MLNFFRPPCSASGEMVDLSHPDSTTNSTTSTQQNFLDVLSHFRTQCQEVTPSYSTINTADISSNMPKSTAQSPLQTQFTSGYDNLDVQEAVSLLAILRNSGMSYE